MQQEEWQGCLFLIHKHKAAASHAYYGRDRHQQPATTQTNKQTKDLKTYASVGRADSDGGDDSNDGRELHC